MDPLNDNVGSSLLQNSKEPFVGVLWKDAGGFYWQIVNLLLERPNLNLYIRLYVMYSVS